MEQSPRELSASPPFLPNFTAGLIIGVLEIFQALSFAALIFSGDLAPYISQGIGLSLMGMVVIGLVIAAFTSLPGTVGGSQGVSVAIITLMAAAIAAEMPAAASSQESFITVVAAIAVTALITGIFFWVLGHFRLGGLVRFLPYPVVGGFMAGTGWLLLTGAIGMMIGEPVDFNSLATLFQPEVLVYWLPGFILALAMLLATRRGNHFLILPTFLVGSVLLFFIVVWVGGFSLADLGAAGWLLGPFGDGGGGMLWQPLAPDILAMVNWPAIIHQVANVAAIVAVSAISLLLNAGSLELATDRDLQVDRELQVAGVANMLAALVPGLVGFKQLSLSMLNFKLGGSSRMPGLIAAIMCALAMVAGTSLLEHFPKFVAGSLLLLLGLNFIYDWVIAGWYRLPKIDYAIVLIIFFVTMTVGFLQAVGLGLLLAVILFVISYSQVDVVRHELSGESFQSRVSRSRRHDQVLEKEGQRLYILQLQGFIFFGTANNLLNQLQARINDPDQVKPDFVVLDFLRATGFDSTGMLSFTRMKQLAENAGITLVFTEPNERVLTQLQQGGLGDDGRSIRIFPSLDKGVEWCENHFLIAAGVDLHEPPPPLAHQLQDILCAGEDSAENEAQLEALLAHLEKLDFEPGEVLIAMGDDPDDLYFIESGQVTARLILPDREPVRLETTGSGSVIGEIGFYLGGKRTAEVTADQPAGVLRMSLEDLQELEETRPEISSTLHQIIVRLLAERVIRLTNSVRALER